jgi:flavin reductase (DIM6/NTAB) family NADH-FMN oxidoreductase RutF
VRYSKKDFPLHTVRQHLETGPIVLITSRHGSRSNIMTLGWHTMLQFSPALVGCYIWEGNESRELIRRSGECVINVPTAEIADQVVEIGNRHACEGDKFGATGLTRRPAKLVAAPLIDECYASFECRIHDDAMVAEYGFFIWEVVKAHVADTEAPRTLHYRGHGTFMIAGQELFFTERFRPENL